MNYNDFGLRIDFVEYTVKKGDSLYTIAKAYNTTVSELSDINMLTNTTIFPGQVLLVPKNSNAEVDYYFENYVVKQGDTIEQIAKNMGVDPILLGLYNNIAAFQLIEGQPLKIPRNNTYIVKENDTVDTILQSTNLTAEQLLKANAANWLKVGNKIYL